MPTKMIRQTQFSAGQADHITWKRTDIEQYLTAAQSLLNCEVGTTGLAKKRKGSIFYINATDEAQLESTMYEFVDKNGIYYIILGAGSNFYVFSTPPGLENVINYQGLLVVTSNGSQVVYDNDNIELIQAIPVDYQEEDLFDLDYTQDNDTLILTSPKYPPGRIYISSYSPLTFAFEYLDIYPLPSYDFNNINYNGCTVMLAVTGNQTNFEFSGVPAGTVFDSSWIGGEIVGGGATELSPIGYGIITAVSQTGSNAFFETTTQIAFLATGYATAGSQYSIRQPAWVNTLGDPFGLGYPAKVLYFQNRLWFANTKLLPITIFGSKLNQPISFDVGTGLDTDAIIYTIGQSNTGSIQWMNGGKQLEIFTNNYEFACPQNEDIGLTPSSFSIRQQSSYGSSILLKPETYLNDTYFAQKTGKAWINFHFTGVGLAYQSSNIAPQSQELMKNPTNRALLRGTDISQDNFIYLLNPIDNTITIFQFASEINLSALTPMTFQENVQLIDIVTVNNQVYILKYYILTQQFTIEQLQTGVYIDSSDTYTLNADGIIDDLYRLEGYTVQVVYQNQDFGQYLVSGGQITVNNPLLLEGTAFVGLLFDVEIKPMYPYYSSTSAPFEKQIYRIYIDYYESLNFQINGDLVQYQNFKEIQLGLPLIPKTGTAITSTVTGYNRFDDDLIVITQSSPFDLQILSIGYQIEMAVI